MEKNTKGRDVALVRSISQPFSLQAEQAIIGAILYDPNVLLDDLSGKLADEHFYDPFCRVVYQKASAMALNNETVDLVLLSARLEGTADMSEDEVHERLTAIFYANPNKLNLEGWAKIVAERWTERQLASVGQKLMEMAHQQDITVEEKVSESHLLLSKVGSIMAEDTIISPVEMVASALEEVEQNAQNGGKVSGMSTGWEDFDAMTSGLRPGDLVVLAARPSMGKTSLAVSMIEHPTFGLPVGERKSVLLFSLEMGKTQIGMRWLSVIYGVPLAHLRGGNVSGPEFGRLSTALLDAEDCGFHMEESGSLTMEALAAKARRHKREHGLDMIIVDYLQLISDSGSNRNASKAERVGDISRGLKMLAKELQVPVIALSQLSRNLETRQDKRPIMSDLRESGAIEQDADIIIFLYRDWIYNKNTQSPDEAEIIFAKQRNGATGTVKLQFEKTTTRFHDGQPRQRQSLRAA